MDDRLPIDARAVVLMVVLCVIWAFQQIAIKLAAPDLSPLMQLAIRSGLATLVVAALMRRQGEPIFVDDGTWRPGLLAGLLFALEFVLIGEGLRRTTASHLVVFLYTAPIFAALGLHWTLPAERLRPLQWIGILLAFVGVAVTFLWRPAAVNAATGAVAPATNLLAGDLLALLSGASWGATTVVIRNSALARASAKRTLLYQLACACVLPWLVALAMGQGHMRMTPVLGWSLAFQTLVVASTSYLVWFWLLRRYLATRLGVFSFLTPLFGIGFGVVFLHEAIESSFALGAALVLAGVVLVSGSDALMRAWAARAKAAGSASAS